METIFTEGLVFMTDLSGFNRIVRDRELSETVEVLKRFAEISRSYIEGASGTLIKFIGDSALGYFPAGKVDEGMAALLAMKGEIEENFEVYGNRTGLRIGAHYGPFAICSFPPFDDLPDLVGETVNIAARTGSGGQAKHRSQLIITPEAFRKLNSHSRKVFHKFTEPIVYLA